MWHGTRQALSPADIAERRSAVATGDCAVACENGQGLRNGEFGDSIQQLFGRATLDRSAAIIWREASPIRTHSGGAMTDTKQPTIYLKLKRDHPTFFAAVDALGKTVRTEGPLDEKTGHLIQLAAAAAIRSEGAVHSHTRRALETGVKPAEIHHALILLTSTIGFPQVVAALCWAEDIIGKK